jgi:hypothetical protein
LSRFRVFALLAVLAALTTAFAACGSSDSDKSGEDPQTVVDDATLEGVKSGNLELTVGIKAEGDEGGDIDVSLSGPFQAGAKGDLPQLAMTASANGSAEGEKVDFEGGLTLLSDRAYVNYEGTEYEVDQTTFGFVKSGFEQAQQEGGSEGNPADVTACQEAASGFKVGDFVNDLTNDGSADVDGTATTKISGDLDVDGAISAIIKLAEDPACSSQLEAAGPLPIGELEAAKGEVASAVKKAHVEVYVGDDNIIRRLVAELTIEPQGSSKEKVEANIDLTLSEVNEEQEITAPANAKPLQGLFQKLDINPVELLEAGSSGEGLGDLLEGVIGDDASGGGSSGGSGGSSGSSGGGGGSADPQAYLDCLKGAETPADLQNCAGLVQ